MSAATGPTLSICIPTFNRPRELSQAVRSVLDQDDDAVEVVIGDNGASRNPPPESRDPRVQYSQNPHNLGMAGNWTATLDRSTGEFVGLLMDDDQLLPGFTQAVREIFASNPSVGVVFTNHLFRDGEFEWERACSLDTGLHDDFLHDLLVHRPVAVSAAIMRRQVWESVRPLPDRVTADVVLFVRAAQAGWSFHYINEPLMVYRVHDGQITGSEERFRDDCVGLWSDLSFTDPADETLRKTYLSRSLVSRAATHVKRYRFAAAVDDLNQAEALAGHLSHRAVTLRFLADHPLVGRPVAGATARLGPLRSRLAREVRNHRLRGQRVTAKAKRPTARASMAGSDSEFSAVGGT